MQIGISVTMSVSFRGVQQEFSNVFHYQRVQVGDAPWEALLDEVVTAMRPLHSTDVSFKWGRVWTSGGSPAQNEMKFQKALSGTGAQGVNGSLDRERAILIRWPAGKNILGRPVYLRKWFHPCGACAGVGFTAGHLQNTEALADINRTQIADAAEALREIGVTETWGLCAASGRENTGGAQCHKYLEHHQLGDMWR